MDRTISRRPAAAKLSIWSIGVLLYVLIHPLLPDQLSGWTFTALHLTSGVLMLWASRSMGADRRVIWRVMGIGLLIYGIGNLIWFFYNLVLGAQDAVINTANIAYATGYFVMATGVAIGVRRRDPHGFRLRIIDTAIVFSGSAVVWWMWLIQPVVGDTSVSIPTRLTAGLYPIGDLVLLAATGALALMPGLRRSSNRLLIAAFVAMLVSDGIYYYQSLRNDYVFGGLLDTGWLIAFGLFGAAALTAQHEPNAMPAASSKDSMTRKRVIVFVAAALIGPGVLAFTALSGHDLHPGVVIISSLALYLLVLGRMMGLLQDQESKVREIDLKNIEIAASEERHRNVVNGLSEVIFQMDMNARWTFLNEAWTEVSGRSVEESLGRSCLETVHPDDREKLISFFTTLIQGEEESLRYEIRGVHADGSTRWIEIFVRVKLSPDGQMVGSAGTLIDITERKRAEMALAEAEAKYRTLVEQIPVVTYIDSMSSDESNLYINCRITDLLGYTPEEWSSDPQAWKKHLHPDDRDRVLLEHDRCAVDNTAFRLEYRVLHRDGHVVWVRDEATLIYEDGEPAFWQGVVIDVTERKVLEEQLAHQAFHDPLTNLANRALFSDRVSHAIQRGSRHFGSSVAVLFIDLDDFKTVNDSLGHGMGDDLLKAVSERIQASLRLSDTAARLGGDEFAVLIEDVSSAEDAQAAAERIIEALVRPFRIDEHEIHMGASIGIALSSNRDETVDELLRNADLAMYIAKGDKGRHALFEDGMHTAALGRLQLKADLAAALDNGELTVFYQPVIDLRTSRMIGTEALLRWNHPQRGMVPPLEFIPLAEESDLINEIGCWVLHQACAQAMAFSNGDPSLAGCGMTVNLSGRQLLNPNLVDEVRSALDESGLPPHRLVLEITETALMTDLETSIETLKSLKALGVKLAVDDFGTGYSSLSYLRRFPLDILKIDRSFVDEVNKGPEEAALASAVIKLGHTLGLTSIAEGVEIQEQADALVDLGCHLVQGFLYSRPVPPEELLGFTLERAGVA